MIVTLDQLNEAFADATEENVAKYLNAFNTTCEAYSINTPKRMAAFIAQVAQESANLRTTTENLNYSADGLLKTFKKYFNSSDAQQYARKPEKIANRVYANRMGNGDEASGDGWRFCGHGVIQLTGRTNHELFAKDRGLALDEALVYLTTPEGAMMSAGWFWNRNKLNGWADMGNITKVSQLVNGGNNGLAERAAFYKVALDALT